mmetsp:Transcript_22188/g.68302  ORF Transcript_22188/g.68302 Transcript_22188/m.68302 type:complete len:211 (-) Transcript_22188:795-1427(-)
MDMMRRRSFRHSGGGRAVRERRKGAAFFVVLIGGDQGCSLDDPPRVRSVVASSRRMRSVGVRGRLRCGLSCRTEASSWSDARPLVGRRRPRGKAKKRRGFARAPVKAMAATKKEESPRNQRAASAGGTSASASCAALGKCGSMPASSWRWDRAVPTKEVVTAQTENRTSGNSEASATSAGRLCSGSRSPSARYTKSSPERRPKTAKVKAA